MTTSDTNNELNDSVKDVSITEINYVNEQVKESYVLSKNDDEKEKPIKVSSVVVNEYMIQNGPGMHSFSSPFEKIPNVCLWSSNTWLKFGKAIILWMLETISGKKH